jgi:hypothetical protein
VLEAIVLPVLLFASALVGGMRVSPGGEVAFVPPTVMTLLLGLLLLGVAAQAGVLSPARLVSPARTGLAMANGVVLLATVVLAGAQVFGALTPSRGIFTLVAHFFFLTTLLLMFTARPDATRFQRSLALLFGAALLGRHVLLAQLAPDTSTLSGRLVSRALEGVTLGALGLEQHGPAAGYLALGAALALWVALWLAPVDQDGTAAPATEASRTASART